MPFTTLGSVTEQNSEDFFPTSSCNVNPVWMVLWGLSGASRVSFVTDVIRVSGLVVWEMRQEGGQHDTSV